MNEEEEAIEGLRDSIIASILVPNWQSWNDCQLAYLTMADRAEELDLMQAAAYWRRMAAIAKKQIRQPKRNEG